MKYLLPGVILDSELKLEEFSDFEAENPSSFATPEISLKMTDEEPNPEVKRAYAHAQINISEIEGGWLFRTQRAEPSFLFVRTTESSPHG